MFAGCSWFDTQAVLGWVEKAKGYRYVIHTVGPQPGKANKYGLKQAVCLALNQATLPLPDQAGRRLTHIAIPMMCASAFEGADRMEQAKAIILNSVEDWLEGNQDMHNLQEIRLVLFVDRCALFVWMTVKLTTGH